MTRTNTTLTIVTAGLLGALQTTALAGPVEIPTGPVGDVIDAQGQASLDYNCDGIISGPDVLMLVASGSFDINTFLDMMANWGATDYDVNCDLIVDRDDMFRVAEQVNPDTRLVDAFRNHWGETGTPYDLNCDDVVNGLDYMQMVTSGSFDIREALALVADWGASPHPLDLDCDGVVGIVDFLAGLAALTDSEG